MTGGCSSDKSSNLNGPMQTPMHDFSLVLNNGKDLNYMLTWVKETYSRLPPTYANVLIFNTLTGLRSSEACMAIGLIHTDSNNCINQSAHTLEHFRFPGFIRRTKKAYNSVYNDRIIEAAKDTITNQSYLANTCMMSYIQPR